MFDRYRTMVDMLDADRTKTAEAVDSQKPALAGSRYGVWLGLRALPEQPSALSELAAEVEALGFSALWLGGSWGADLTVPRRLLEGSRDLVVATSVSNIWRDPAEQVAASYTDLAAEYGDRFVLGLGPGHHTQVNLHQDRYARPLAMLGEYLDALDAAKPPVPVGRRALAALGPKALALAAERSAGALPYLTTPDHTRQAREVLGARPFLAPEQKIILATDPDDTRALARRSLEYYLSLPNYVNAWRRLGFAEADFEGGGSERLIDAVYGWGKNALDRVQEHLSAGADHVCIQPIPAAGKTPLDELRIIARELG
jgi:probable F420-dependent oxidoreductase